MKEIRHRTHGRATAARLKGLTRMAVIFVLTAVLGMTGFFAASAFAGSAGSRTNATLSLRQTNLGQILVGSKGRTLYVFMKDMNGKSACSGTCATYWPPLITTGKWTAGPGVNRALVGRTKRADGRLQVTYKQHPLYTFALDKSAGQTKGQGLSDFGATWYAVSAKGKPVLKAPTTTTTDTTTTPTYPYP